MKALAAILALLVANTSLAAGDDRLPDHRVAEAGGDIVQAWLMMPTDRYRHFVLGAQYEAAGVRVRLADGSLRDFILPEDSVFEDREPRLVDLDADGRNELVLVKSVEGLGASLTVLGLRNDELQIMAETPPIGRANRWLNPAGFGRFIGNTRLQIALVRMPHILGRLEIWDYGRGGLILAHTHEGFSNHRIGSRHQRLSAVLPRHDGTDLLLIPRMDRREVVLLDLSAQEPVIDEFPLPSPIDGDIQIRCDRGNFLVNAPLEDGRIENFEIRVPEMKC